MQKHSFRVTVIVLGLLSVGLLGYVLSQARIKLSFKDNVIRAETNFPNADCEKTVSAKFPFVHFNCQQQGVPEADQEILQNKP